MIGFTKEEVAAWNGVKRADLPDGEYVGILKSVSCKVINDTEKKAILEFEILDPKEYLGSNRTLFLSLNGSKKALYWTYAALMALGGDPNCELEEVESAFNGAIGHRVRMVLSTGDKYQNCELHHLDAEGVAVDNDDVVF